jgi:hypothetical protein
VTRVTDQVEWARDLAASLLAPLGQRWTHTLGRSSSAHERSPLSYQLRSSTYWWRPRTCTTSATHPRSPARGSIRSNGARFLRALGRERLACGVAHHSGARAEAEERGLLEALERVPEERSLGADARTYCDLTTAPDGSPTAASITRWDAR